MKKILTYSFMGALLCGDCCSMEIPVGGISRDNYITARDQRIAALRDFPANDLINGLIAQLQTVAHAGGFVPKQRNSDKLIALIHQHQIDNYILLNRPISRETITRDNYIIARDQRINALRGFPANDHINDLIARLETVVPADNNPARQTNGDRLVALIEQYQIDNYLLNLRAEAQ